MQVYEAFLVSYSAVVLINCKSVKMASLVIIVKKEVKWKHSYT